MEQIPVSVAIKNFKRDLIDVINHSGLHISVIDMIFREVYSEIKETKMQVEANEENAMHKMMSQLMVKM